MFDAMGTQVWVPTSVCIGCDMCPPHCLHIQALSTRQSAPGFKLGSSGREDYNKVFEGFGEGVRRMLLYVPVILRLWFVDVGSGW